MTLQPYSFALVRRRSLKDWLGLLAVSLSLSASSHVQAINLVTDQGSFATQPGLTLADFENIAPVGGFTGNLPQPFIPGVTFNASNPRIISKSFSNPNFPGGAPSDFLIDDNTLENIPILFDGKITSVGLRIALNSIGRTDEGGPVKLELYDEATLLSSIDVQVSGTGPFDTFFGFSDFGTATELRILHQSRADVIAIDDLYFFAVPESNPTLVLIVGSFMARTRKRRFGLLNL